VLEVIMIPKQNIQNLAWGNTDSWQKRSYDQVKWRSKYPLLISHTRHEPLVEIMYTGLPVVLASMEMQLSMMIAFSIQLNPVISTICVFSLTMHT
jgi:hypothetical protein